MSKGRRYRVSGLGHVWLRALDPLAPGEAHLVRSEWIPHKNLATRFPSITYAETVAANAPDAEKRSWQVHSTQRKEVK